jgi:hypothetical protein
MNCWHCGQEIALVERVGLRDYCPGCDRALHACRNCDFYDPTYNNQCREPMAERVVDKERANFCEYFAPAIRARAPAPREAKTDPRTRLDELFKKKR